MRKLYLITVILALVIAGCSSPLGTSDSPRPIVVEAKEISEDDIPENATVVNASQLNLSQNDLNGLFDRATASEGSVSKNYRQSDKEEIQRQLSAAPQHEDYYYIQYQGDMIRVGIYKLN